MNAFRASSAIVLLSFTVACVSEPVPKQIAPVRSIVNAQIRASICDEPTYSTEPLGGGETGVVMVAFLISAQGEVLDNKVVLSSGFPRLDALTAEGLSRCKFIAGTRDGTPTEMWTAIKFSWRLPPKVAIPSGALPKIPEKSGVPVN